MAPASALSSEPHSFSRVFTAAWLESLAEMLDRRGATPATLAAVAVDAGRLLVAAVRSARISSNYFAQVSAGLLAADAGLFDGTYRDGLRRAFVGRGILSMSSADDTRDAAGARAAAPSRRATALRTIGVPIDGRAYGLRLRRLLVEAPLGPARWSAASAALDLGSLAAATPERASRAFVEDLLRRGRVDASALAPTRVAPRRSGRTTHALVRQGGDVKLVRRRFHELAGDGHAGIGW
jgi:hypothetical protein